MSASETARPSLARHGTSSPPSERSLIEVGTALLLRRRRILICAGFGAVVALAIAWTASETYVTHAAIMSQGPSGVSRLAGLASQFGINVASGQGGATPELYAQLIRSDNILRPVADAHYSIAIGDHVVAGDLAAVLESDGAEPRLRRANAIRMLKRTISTNVDDASGLLNLNVATTSPNLSLQIAEQLLLALDAANNAVRQKQSETEGQFIETQLAEQATELREAEDRMRDFLSRNRMYQSDPQLVVEYNRITRTLQMRQDVYTTLAQGYQQLRIDGARNTPTLSVVQPPLRADTPEPKAYPLYLVIGVMLGGGLAVLSVLLEEYVSVVRASHPEAYERAAVEARAALRPFRRVRTKS